MQIVRTVSSAVLLGVSQVGGIHSATLRAEPPAQSAGYDPAIQSEFIEAMRAYAAHDYRRAEAIFRRILDRDPRLLRVRLELARTLFMEKEDEQADYQFRLAAASHPGAVVLQNIIRFREAIRSRRAWRFSVDVGFAPDSNIDAATSKDSIDIYGLPFRLDSSARAHSGVGMFAGGDASVRLNRFGKVPIYIEAYSRWTGYRDHRFDDAYAGVEAGPEFQLKGGRLRATVTGLERWYGEHPLVTSVGGHFAFEKVVRGKWTVGGALIIRHNDYRRRDDVDGWDAEVRASVDRTLGSSALGFAYADLERSWAEDPGQAFWRGRLGVGAAKEIRWGLRPQLAFGIGREIGDAPLVPFGKQRRDWLFDASLSIYRREWNVGGFAPSLSLTWTRGLSTLELYRQKRLRAEIRLTRAF